MPKPKTKQGERQITYKILEVRKLSHFENDPSELNVSRDDLQKPVHFTINTSISVDSENSTISLKANAVFFIEKNNIKIDLFGLTAIYKFHLSDFKKNFLKEDNNVAVPEQILIIFANILISGIRGMFAALNTRPEYSHIMLPPMNPASVIKKKSHSETFATP